MKKVFVSLFLMLLLSVEVAVGEQVLFQNHKNGVYHTGDRVRVVLFLGRSGCDTIQVKVQKDFSNVKQQTQVYCGDSLVVMDETLKGSSTLVVEVKGRNWSESTGVIVDPERYTPGTLRPKDIDAFWKSKKRELSKLPLVVKREAVKVKEEAYECFNVELSCLGPAPARGYFAKPKQAAKRSLPIVVYFHAAGVKGDWCRSEPGNALRYAKMGRGALCFDLNAHGMLNGQKEEYYQQLDSTTLKNYPLIGSENRETCYFLGMYWRLLRTIDFLTQQPEWDGKRVLVLGESQGGGQALVAAALDSRVKAVVATVPAMCDWGGVLVGRKGSWPYPYAGIQQLEQRIAAMSYFDVAHLLQNTKATLLVEIGLIDQTCPSSALYAAINKAKGEKIIFTVPYRAHHFTQQQFKPIYDREVDAVKQKFIFDYLK